MLLAAGRGTRLKPLTDNIPKCMVRVRGKPVLEHNIEWLRKFGVERIVINLHHLPNVVMDYFGNGAKWGVEINYSVEDELLGTAGGVKKVEWFFDAPFFLWYGDNLSTCNVERMWRFHEAKGGVATLALFHRDDPTASGIVGLDGQDRILRFLEKPRPQQVFSNWVNAGIAVLEPQVLLNIPAEGAPDFGRDVFPSMLESGLPMYGYRMAGEEKLWWIDTLHDLARVQEEMQ